MPFFAASPDMLPSFALAFAAGALSFFSPCVLPLLPAYLASIAGQKDQQKRRIFFFIAGFATLFILLGLAAAGIGQLFLGVKFWLERAAGLVILLFGLHIAGFLPAPVLLREYRPALAGFPRAPASSPFRAGVSAYGLGLAFGFGWTPCIGPVLGAILALAAHEASPLAGASLLAVYAAGLGLPFALAGFGLLGALPAFARRHTAALQRAAGLILVITGGAIIAGVFTRAGFWLLWLFPSLGALG